MATTQKSPKARRDIYKEVTDRIVEAVTNGTAPWQRPWKVIDRRHRNLVSKKPYRGINIFLLNLTAMEKGYTQPYWLTFNQAKKLGGKVTKGEKSTLVVLWKPINIKDEKDLDDKGQPKRKRIWLVRHYNVFNIEQTEGIEFPPPSADLTEHDPIEEAERVCDEMPEAPKTTHGHNYAAYSPIFDEIYLPDMGQFDEVSDYYRTRWHEMAHATGAEKRLHRVKDWSFFGDEKYAKEELAAEMTSAMLAGFVGIEGRDQSAGYVKNWLGALKDDKTLVVKAASQAQRAADYILNVKPESEEPSNGNA